MAQTRTTEQEAVNTMLATVGEAPINTLAGDLTADIQIAVNLLRDTSRAVQSMGWSFNTEKEYELSINGSGEIEVPGDALEVDLSDVNSSWAEDVIMRGNRMYDKYNHTYTFTENKKFDIVWFLPWTELPEAARNYIKIRAARVYQDQTVGSKDHHTFSMIDEVQALTLLQIAEAEAGDYNIFDSPDMASIVNRRRPRIQMF